MQHTPESYFSLILPLVEQLERAIIKAPLSTDDRACLASLATQRSAHFSTRMVRFAAELSYPQHSTRQIEQAILARLQEKVSEVLQ
ncbi:hypothetical protein [Polycladidibacter hongkongensis]|uniref:hypothetical protein n=1 Tax=Polycladidibacter hongkongensis TaxID=1647556 RepID=UPI00082B1DE3|nr:hypothetical protein [Pseudovibrio hongkongensis]